MLVHSVYFWLKKELTPRQVADFRDGLESLRGIAAAEQMYIGTPSDTPPRPVIDDTYSFALVVVLTDVAGHDAYQDDPLHKDFLHRFSGHWDHVRIYDFE